MKPGLLVLLMLSIPILEFAQTPNSHPMSRGVISGRAETAKELIEIMHCLKVGDRDWLADSAALAKAKWLRVGITHDRRSYSGEDVIFAVVLESPASGDVFELTRHSDKTHREYTIENNGSFQLGRRGFEWRNEILGGIWTHEYFERNVRKIMRGSKIWVSAKSVLRPITGVSCGSYVTAN